MSFGFRFWAKISLNLCLALCCAFIALLLSNAPFFPRQPFGGISIKSEQSPLTHLPNRLFTCQETESEFQCRGRLQGRSLALSFVKGKSYKYDLTDCRASYNGQPVSCQYASQTYTPILTLQYEVAVKLDRAEIQSIRQKYWGINLLANLGEDRLTAISSILSFATGLAAILWMWLNPGRLSKVFVSILCGFGMYNWVWRVLARVPYSTVTNTGFPMDWNLFSQGGAICAALITVLVVALLIGRKRNRFARFFIGLANGCLLIPSMAYTFLWLLLELGYVD